MTPPYLIITFLLFLPLADSQSQSQSQSQSKLYADHCSHTVPDSPVTDFRPSDSKFLSITHAYYTGGEPILLSNLSDSSKLFTFTTFGVRNTRVSDVFQFEATMYFRNQMSRRRYEFRGGFGQNGKQRRRLTEFRIRGPRVPVTMGGGGLSFSLHGFWSARSGDGCAVGSGMSRSDQGILVSHPVVFRFRYLNSSSIETSLVNGVVESLDDERSSAFFKPIYVIGISAMGYEYTLVENTDENWGGGVANPELGADFNSNFEHFVFGSGAGLNLVYESDCISRNCNPLGSRAGDLPGLVYIRPLKMKQSDMMARLLIKFYNSDSSFEYRSFTPDASLVGEGVWDRKMNQLHVVACRIVNHTNSLVNASVGDCSIRLSLTFPSIYSLRNRSRIVGDIWSTSSVNDSGYFDKVGFSSRWSVSLLSSAKYEYTVIDTVKNSCTIAKTSEGKYPHVYSTDMYLNLQIKSKKNKGGLVKGFPVSVGDHILSGGVHNEVRVTNSTIVNIGYALTLHFRPLNMKFNDLNMDGILVSAEGTYDTKRGALCMVGCLLVRSSDGKLWKNASLDCETRFNIQFPPLNADAKHQIKGTISSTRASTDPHYFEPMEVSSRSIYTNVAEESIWRMDIEMTLVLASKTLACVFVGLQLYYGRKWPETPPFISILMLVVLTLGHMIPLLLNFEALFVSRDVKSNVSLDSGGWLAVNEVTVRIVTMVAFLLQFRLLQLTWSCRLTDTKSKGIWDSEKKVIYTTLPIYICGMMIAWFARQQNHLPANTTLDISMQFQHYQIHKPRPVHNQLSALWGSLKAYGGLVHDGFLLPQILLNMFHNSQETPLAHSFYIGTTFLRVLPHLYDLYRGHKGFDFPTLRLLYANHVLDFYSTAWNIIISCIGLMFAGMIFSQQRFGGQCLLPKRFRKSCEYEKVGVVNSEQQ